MGPREGGQRRTDSLPQPSCSPQTFDGGGEPTAVQRAICYAQLSNSKVHTCLGTQGPIRGTRTVTVT